MKRSSKKRKEIKSLDECLEISSKSLFKWFRGNNTEENVLTPGIFRKKFRGIEIPKDPDTEFFLAEEFKRRSPLLSPELPDRNDYLSWLVLMQHHGVPTRLLDWTENILIAVYFAVSDKIECNGELWVMNPSHLNKMTDPIFLNGLATIDNTIVQYLAAEPMYLKTDEAQTIQLDDYGLTTPPKYPIAIQSPLYLPRMVSQFSTFTIHPRPQENYTIPEVLKDEKDLIRFTIPSKSKSKILRELYLLGFRRQTLYQDLDSLAKDLLFEIPLRTEISK
jgi:hypothetical protein